MVVSDLIEEVSRYLQDNEFEDDVSYVHWTKKDLLSYLRNAVSIVAMVRKEEFVTTIDVELVEGVVQTLPAPCKSLKTVQGQKDDRGVIQSRVRETKISKLSFFSRPACSARSKSDTGYVIRSFSYDENDPKTIYVDPPVGKGQTATLTVSCYAPPTISGEDDILDIDANMRAVIFELMLYYAYGVDIEDEANRQRSNTHFEVALKLLQIYDYKEQQALTRVAQGLRNG